MSWKHSNKEAGEKFFEARKNPVVTPKKTITTEESVVEKKTTMVTAIDTCNSACSLVAKEGFRKAHKSKGAPIAMTAFAQVIHEQIIRDKNCNLDCYFDGLTITAPTTDTTNPDYYSIIGQKLLFVDWERRCGCRVKCPVDGCSGHMRTGGDDARSNFSKSKTLFPIFGLDGPPAWCIATPMVCTQSPSHKFQSNESRLMLNVPPHFTEKCPVELSYCLPNRKCHLSRSATTVFDNIMLTYGNGELCSKMLFDSLNACYLQWLESYYSYLAFRTDCETAERQQFVEKDGCYIKTFPPLGPTIKGMCNEAASSNGNRWGLSDHDRHTREIQSVKCSGIFAQDHTFRIVDNYENKHGSKACWDAATETGEIATAVLAPTTKTIHFAHAAKQLSCRPEFKPKAMCSDTWPHKDAFWNEIFPGIEGRLGLFHYEKRIISTMNRKHIDYHEAITALLNCLYAYCAPDYEKLLVALKNGTLSGSKLTSQQINDMRNTPLFRERYDKYLRKELRQPATMVQMLDDWFCTYKVTCSDPINRPAKGRLDPVRCIPLFTSDTKQAVLNCKEKAVHLKDPLPLEEMCDKILPHPESKHQLTEYLSKRGESKLESWHDRAAHYANVGMRTTLANNLNLAGTARHNLRIRHKRMFINITPTIQEARKKTPLAYEKMVPYYNHTQLWHLNQLATDVGLPIPFPNAEKLCDDTGEKVLFRVCCDRETQ